MNFPEEMAEDHFHFADFYVSGARISRSDREVPLAMPFSGFSQDPFLKSLY